MLRLVTIDLSEADIALFEAYEARVLPLVARHGGRLIHRLRAVDGESETHLLFFADVAAFERYRTDPERLAALPDWDRCGATSTVMEVEEVGS